MRSLFIFLLALTACAEKSSKQTSTAADTTQVIEVALKTLLVESFPDMNGIKRKSSFHDSIFLTTNLLPLSSLPSSVDSFHFKILPDSAICSVIKSDTATVSCRTFFGFRLLKKRIPAISFASKVWIVFPPPQKMGPSICTILKTNDKYLFKKN